VWVWVWHVDPPLRVPCVLRLRLGPPGHDHTILLTILGDLYSCGRGTSGQVRGCGHRTALRCSLRRGETPRPNGLAPLGCCAGFPAASSGSLPRACRFCPPAHTTRQGNTWDPTAARGRATAATEVNCSCTNAPDAHSKRVVAPLVHKESALRSSWGVWGGGGVVRTVSFVRRALHRSPPPCHLHPPSAFPPAAGSWRACARGRAGGGGHAATREHGWTAGAAGGVRQPPHPCPVHGRGRVRLRRRGGGAARCVTSSPTSPTHSLPPLPPGTGPCPALVPLVCACVETLQLRGRGYEGGG
jgi:hypothetical protein